MKIFRVLITASLISTILSSCVSYSNGIADYNGSSEYLYNMDDGMWIGDVEYDLEEYYAADIENTNSESDEYWEAIPSFSEMHSFIEHMRKCYSERTTTVEVRFVDGFLPSPQDILEYLSLPWLNTEVYFNNGETAHVVYTMMLYPGTRVADAYLSRDTSSLSKEEMELYKIAKEIVEDAEDLRTDMDAELYLHDKICEATTYYNEEFKENMPRYCTALGVFLDGRANCQGYADAFYMLAAMYGFDVDKLTGTTDRGDHVWNLIEIDGMWYSVDVCWNDETVIIDDKEYIQYFYFNAPMEIIGYDHRWDSLATSRRLQYSLDDANFYYNDKGDDDSFGHHERSMEKALQFTSEQLMSGDKEVHISAPLDTDYDDSEEVCKEINRMIENSNHPEIIYYTVLIKNLGQHTFMFVEAA